MTPSCAIKRRRRRLHLESLEARVVLDSVGFDPENAVLPGQAEPDSFYVRSGSKENRLDVLANDFLDVVIEAQPLIASVGPASAGGSVKIAHEGLLLLYTPAKGFSGKEAFTYYVDAAHSATVTVQVLKGKEEPPAGSDNAHGPDDVIRIDLAITDAGGKEIQKLELGEKFYVDVLVKDLRPDPDGVFSAYLDLQFDSKLAKVAGEFEFGEMFSNGWSGKVVEGEIDELGAFSSSLKPTGDKAQLLVRIPFTAIQSGSWNVSVNPPDEFKSHDAGVFGHNLRISSYLVEFDSLSIKIANKLHNKREPTDVNRDFSTTPLDALAAINQLNAGGGGSLAEESRPVASRYQADGTQQLMSFDVNDDNYLTPTDPLTVINWLTARRKGEGESAAELATSDVGSAVPTVAIWRVPVGSAPPRDLADQVDRPVVCRDSCSTFASHCQAPPTSSIADGPSSVDGGGACGQWRPLAGSVDDGLYIAIPDGMSDNEVFDQVFARW